SAFSSYLAGKLWHIALDKLTNPKPPVQKTPPSDVPEKAPLEPSPEPVSPKPEPIPGPSPEPIPPKRPGYDRIFIYIKKEIEIIIRLINSGDSEQMKTGFNKVDMLLQIIARFQQTIHKVSYKTKVTTNIYVFKNEDITRLYNFLWAEFRKLNTLNGYLHDKLRTPTGESLLEAFTAVMKELISGIEFKQFQSQWQEFINTVTELKIDYKKLSVELAKDDSALVQKIKEIVSEGNESLLTDIRKLFPEEGIDKALKDLNDRFTALTNEVKGLRDEVTNLRSDISDLNLPDQFDELNDGIKRLTLLYLYLGEDIGIIKTDISMITKRLSEIDVSLKNHTDKLASIQDSLEILAGTNEDIKAIIRSCFNNLSKRISALEKAVEKNTNELARYNDVLDNIRMAISKHDFEGLLKHLDDLESAISQLPEDVSVNVAEKISTTFSAAFGAYKDAMAGAYDSFIERVSDKIADYERALDEKFSALENSILAKFDSIINSLQSFSATNSAEHAEMLRLLHSLHREIEEMKRNRQNPPTPPPAVDPNKQYQLYWIIARSTKVHKFVDAKKTPQDAKLRVRHYCEIPFHLNSSANIAITVNLNDKSQIQLTHNDLLDLARDMHTKKIAPDDATLCLGAWVVGSNKTPCRWDTKALKESGLYGYIKQYYDAIKDHTQVKVSGRIVPVSFVTDNKTGKDLCTLSETEIGGHLHGEKRVAMGIVFRLNNLITKTEEFYDKPIEDVKLTDGLFSFNLPEVITAEHFDLGNVRQLTAKDIQELPDFSVPDLYNRFNYEGRSVTLFPGIILYVRINGKRFYHIARESSVVPSNLTVQKGRGGLQYYAKAFNRSTLEDNPLNDFTNFSGVPIRFSAKSSKKHLHEEYVVIAVPNSVLGEVEPHEESSSRGATASGNRGEGIGEPAIKSSDLMNMDHAMQELKKVSDLLMNHSRNLGIEPGERLNPEGLIQKYNQSVTLTNNAKATVFQILYYVGNQSLDDNNYWDVFHNMEFILKYLSETHDKWSSEFGNAGLLDRNGIQVNFGNHLEEIKGILGAITYTYKNSQEQDHRNSERITKINEYLLSFKPYNVNFPRDSVERPVVPPGGETPVTRPVIPPVTQKKQAQVPTENQIYVFGYGSLIWDNAEYEPVIIPAKLIGAHRSFNQKSTISRGTKDKPGIVLGLEPGGECIGKALLIDKKYKEEIQKREGKAYIEVETPNESFRIVDETGNPINCVLFISNTEHSNYIGDTITVEEKARMAIDAGQGKRGTSVDYIKGIYDGCKNEGISDDFVTEMYNAIEKLQKVEQTPQHSSEDYKKLKTALKKMESTDEWFKKFLKKNKIDQDKAKVGWHDKELEKHFGELAIASEDVYSLFINSEEDTNPLKVQYLKLVGELETLLVNDWHVAIKHGKLLPQKLLSEFAGKRENTLETYHGLIRLTYELIKLTKYIQDKYLKKLGDTNGN
ncbi:MAG: gamma-glutamylcyclotransferase, partial [Candidatus Woesearchaeota archaeon]